MYPILVNKYFTFQEVLNLYPARAPIKPHSSTTASNWFTKMLEDAGLKIELNGLDSTFTPAVINGIIDSLMTQVYNRHASDYIYKVKYAYMGAYDLELGDFDYSMTKLINVINLTAPRFIPLFKQFQNKSSDPIARIGSKTEGKTHFNDTPQDSGAYDTESYATNTTNSVSETQVDSGSIMERLDGLFKNFRSIILEWSNEFNSLFIKEEQIYE